MLGGDDAGGWQGLDTGCQDRLSVFSVQKKMNVCGARWGVVSCLFFLHFRQATLFLGLEDKYITLPASTWPSTALTVVFQCSLPLLWLSLGVHSLPAKLSRVAGATLSHNNPKKNTIMERPSRRPRDPSRGPPVDAYARSHQQQPPQQQQYQQRQYDAAPPVTTLSRSAPPVVAEPSGRPRRPTRGATSSPAPSSSSTLAPSSGSGYSAPMVPARSSDRRGASRPRRPADHHLPMAAAAERPLERRARSPSRGPQLNAKGTIDYRVSRVAIMCRDCGSDVGLYPARHKCGVPNVEFDEDDAPPMPPSSTANGGGGDAAEAGSAWGGLWNKFQNMTLARTSADSSESASGRPSTDPMAASDSASAAPSAEGGASGTPAAESMWSVWNKLKTQVTTAAGGKQADDEDSDPEEVSKALREYYAKKGGPMPKFLEEQAKERAREDDLDRFEARTLQRGGSGSNGGGGAPPRRGSDDRYGNGGERYGSPAPRGYDDQPPRGYGSPAPRGSYDDQPQPSRTLQRGGGGDPRYYQDQQQSQRYAPDPRYAPAPPAADPRYGADPRYASDPRYGADPRYAAPEVSRGRGPAAYPDDPYGGRAPVAPATMSRARSAGPPRVSPAAYAPSMPRGGYEREPAPRYGGGSGSEVAYGRQAGGSDIGYGRR
ncbi:hypothetical protein BC828DRAFT_22607 [Blastocladiella britannica]|nr:hypothetical protein BC828DRAFT_22607 [Blastocladiella britannica]